MKIAGLQKLTLLDYPGKIACTVFTAGCNFRCPFCHNASLVTGKPEELTDEKEIFDLLAKRKGVLQGVCITGGEPTLQKDLLDFMSKVKDMGYKVKLDSNGFKPEILKQAVNEKIVDYIAMDIKNTPEKYGMTVGIKNFDMSPILESIDFLQNSGIDFEFRTTVVKELHTIDDIEKISKWLKGTEKYFLQCFVDSGDTIENGFSGYEQKEMENMLKVAKKYIPTAILRGV